MFKLFYAIIPFKLLPGDKNAQNALAARPCVEPAGGLQGTPGPRAGVGNALPDMEPSQLVMYALRGNKIK